MPRNKFNDPITDQEIAFALLVLSGNMTDQRAARAVGLNPHSAAYTKSKPSVRAFMLEHRARMQRQLVEQEAEAQRPLTPTREQVLNRLWELATLSSEMTRGSISGQIKAISMIVAIEGLIPNRRARSVENQPASPPSQIDPSAWHEQEETTGPQQQDELANPPAEPAPVSAADAPDSGSDSGPVVDSADPAEPAVANHLSFEETQSRSLVPDTRVPFSIDKNRFGRRH
jgi:hypothetical protein